MTESSGAAAVLAQVLITPAAARQATPAGTLTTGAGVTRGDGLTSQAAGVSGATTAADRVGGQAPVEAADPAFAVLLAGLSEPGPGPNAAIAPPASAHGSIGATTVPPGPTGQPPPGDGRIQPLNGGILPLNQPELPASAGLEPGKLPPSVAINLREPDIKSGRQLPAADLVPSFVRPDRSPSPGGMPSSGTTPGTTLPDGAIPASTVPGTGIPGAAAQVPAATAVNRSTGESIQPQTRLASAPPSSGLGPLEATSGEGSELSGDAGAEDQSAPERQALRQALPGIGGELSNRHPSIGFERIDPPLSAAMATSPAQNGPAQSALAQAVDLSLLGDRSTWSESLAQRLATIVNKGMNTADLRLSPPNLGRVEVRITLHNDQASIWLSTPNPEIREMLQQALPRLDALLDNLGIQLADSEVTDQGFAGFLSPEGASAADSDTDGAAAAPDQPARVERVRLGIVDAYV